MNRAEANTLLAPIALERARALAPWVWLGIAIAIAIAPPQGMPLTPPLIAWNGAILSFLAVLGLRLRTRRIAPAYGHIALTAVWWCTLASTLGSRYAVTTRETALILLVELGAASIALHTGSIAVSFLLVDALWLPDVLAEGGTHAVAATWTTLVAELFALLSHTLLRRSLVEAERARRAEALAATRLAEQLAELRRSEEERTRLHEQLLHSQRMEAAGTLAAGLAHDMNNVLAAVTTSAELLEDEVREPAARTELAQIVAQARRGGELTRALLAFSRRGQYRKRVLSVGELVRDVAPLLARTLPKSIQLRTELGSAVSVEGDAVQLGQALINFGVNAADAMADRPPGGAALTIATDEVGLDAAAAARLDLAPGCYARIRVSDTGTGMDAATQRRIFEPFYTTKAVGKGTGLGLSTVWGIAQAHGGTVSVESELGRGTTFALYLPVAARAGAAAGPPPPLPVEARPSGGTVLIVDDEAAVRTGTARMLERAGLRVLVAENGAEGLRVFDAHAAEIQLVILDMGMPVMGGAECFRHLRERSEVPVLVTTGYAVDAEAQALVARGAALLEKPIASRDLRREVMRLLAPSAAREPGAPGAPAAPAVPGSQLAS